MCITTGTKSDHNTANNGGSKTQVLHLAGSSTSDFYFSLSVFYANEGMKVALKDNKTMNEFEFSYAIVHPEAGGFSWSFPKDLDESTIKACQRYNRSEGMAKFGSFQPDIVVPHMFCRAGLTRFRNLCDLVDFEILGPSANSQEIAENKAWSKAIFQSAGVPVPPGEKLVLGENETPSSISLPFVVKPCCEGNSAGISLCHDENEVKAALAEAFKYDDEVLVEKFIPLGRELRVSCIEESDGTINVSPALEYFIPQDIRTSGDKLQVAEEGKEVNFSPTTTQYPADIDQELNEKLRVCAIKAHKALNSRDFSVFDIRVDPEGNPFFLEAGLFCSFAPTSAVVWMASDVIEHQELFRKMLSIGAERGQLRKKSAKENNNAQKSMSGKILISK